MSGVPSRSSREQSLALAALLTLTASVYLPVVRFPFMSIDDPTYVQQNVHIRAGLTVRTITWAFGALDAANWHPLTWLSHALDVQLFGFWAGGHHVTNLLLHLVAVALVFRAVHALTGAAWRSLAVATLFALHPLNVESVAWIAERKNVLSAVFYAGTLLAYAHYAPRPTLARYVWVTALYALGLLAKPMLVTLPCVLFLLDVWPLGRWASVPATRLVVEKLPWLAMSAAVAGITLRAQAGGGAVVALQDHGVLPRVCVATVGYADYLRLLVWPRLLAVYVPRPSLPCTDLPVTVSALTLTAAFLFVAWMAFSFRQAAVVIGWLWFVGMLVPVCGLFQVGDQLLANRYVYHPVVGLGVAVVFGLGDRLSPAWRRPAAAVFVLVALGWAWRTRVELGYWQTNGRLFSRAIEVTGNNCMAQTQLGVALRDRGDLVGAMQRWEEALRQCPDSGEAHSHLGTALASRGELDAAIPHFMRAAESPDIAAAMHHNIGLALWLKGRREEARAELQRALAVDPRYQPAIDLLGRIEAVP